VCSDCGAIFNVYSRPPKSPDVCDHCQGRLVLRPDDRAEVLDQRLKAYHEQTMPVFEVFQRSGRAVHEIDGAQTADEVRQEIFEILRQA
jgi:adenylate kinase